MILAQLFYAIAAALLLVGTPPVQAPTFREATLAAIELMPDWAQFQLSQGYVTAIRRVDAVAGADLEHREIRVTDIMWHSSTSWYASQLVHEAYHLWACVTGDSPAGGVLGEAQAIRWQALALRQMGRPELAIELEASIGKHGVQQGYPTGWEASCPAFSYQPRSNS